MLYTGLDYHRSFSYATTMNEKGEIIVAGVISRLIYASLSRSRCRLTYRRTVDSPPLKP
jgi:hypothetical protein